MQGADNRRRKRLANIRLLCKAGFLNPVHAENGSFKLIVESAEFCCVDPDIAWGIVSFPGTLFLAVYFAFFLYLSRDGPSLLVLMSLKLVALLALVTVAVPLFLTKFPRILTASGTSS